MAYKTWAQVYSAASKLHIMEPIPNTNIRPKFKLSRLELKAIAACESVGLEFWSLAEGQETCFAVGDGHYWHLDFRYSTVFATAVNAAGDTVRHSNGATISMSGKVAS